MGRAFIYFLRIEQRKYNMPKLFVGNIPHTSSDTELQQWVEAQGFQVESAQIIRDRSTGQSRGFGFVVLSEEWKLKDAIAALNGQRMGGRVLTVNEALPQRSALPPAPTRNGRPEERRNRAF
jgi:RNA recognition motif-containing protein